MMKEYDTIVAGYLCVDLVPRFQKEDQETNHFSFFTPGRLIEINGVDFFLGGMVANTGFALKKFNKKVFLNGLIGDDVIGKVAREMLDSHQLLEGIHIANEEGTAVGIVIAPHGIDRIFLESTGCSKIFDINFIDFEAISKGRLFHFGYPPLLRQFYLNDGEQLLKMFSMVKEMGVVTSMDFSLPDTQSESGRQDWPLIMKKVLPFIDIFVPSVEEILQIMMPDEYDRILSSSGNSDIIDLIPVSTIREIGEMIIDLGVKILLIKVGHRGIYLLCGNISILNKETGLGLDETAWKNCELWCDAYPADTQRLINSIGAGDIAAAGFLAAVLDGTNAETAMKYAAIAGRNSLYCNNIYQDLDNWESMERTMNTESIEMVTFCKENKLLDSKSI